MDAAAAAGSRRPAHAGDLARAPVRPTGGHAGSGRPRRRPRPPACRGRLPGTRRNPRGGACRDDGAGGSVQLLSGQEPRRDGGCRSAGHGRRRARRGRAGAPRARPTREVQARRRRLDRSPRHHPRRRAPPEAPVPRRMERPASRRRRSLHRGPRGSRRPRASGLERRGPGLAPVRRSHCRSDGLADHLAASSIGTGRHYPEPPHLSDAYAQLGLRAGVVPRRRADRPGSACLFRCSPESPKRRSDGLSTSIRAWFDRG